MPSVLASRPNLGAPFTAHELRWHERVFQKGPELALVLGGATVAPLGLATQCGGRHLIVARAQRRAVLLGLCEQDGPRLSALLAPCLTRIQQVQKELHLLSKVEGPCGARVAADIALFAAALDQERRVLAAEPREGMPAARRGRLKELTKQFAGVGRVPRLHEILRRREDSAPGSLAVTPRPADLLHQLLEALGHAVEDDVAQLRVIYPLSKRLAGGNEHVDRRVHECLMSGRVLRIGAALLVVQANLQAALLENLCNLPSRITLGHVDQREPHALGQRLKSPSRLLAVALGNEKLQIPLLARPREDLDLDVLAVDRQDELVRVRLTRIELQGAVGRSEFELLLDGRARRLRRRGSRGDEAHGRIETL